MTALTNLHGLPPAMVRAATFETYDKVGDASVTGLIKPPQIARLEALHESEISEDVTDRLWALLGSAMHQVLYWGGRDEESLIQEKRLTMPVAGWLISGKADVYNAENRSVDDYKVTSVWSVVYEPKGRPEWEAQVNLYRLLLEHNGYPVERSSIWTILRDWRDADSHKRPDYPKVPMVEIPMRIWPEEEAMAYLSHRVALHQAAEEDRYDGCTDSDRWLNKGVFSRCERYCRVSQWCEQFRNDPHR